jgi:beta-glucanase (GH16 family)
VFSVIWTEQRITWYIDDHEYYFLDLDPVIHNEFHEDFFFIMNVAVGGNWPGPPDATLKLPQRMIVDYIRVFKPV